jgi:hypothetical protein
MGDYPPRIKNYMQEQLNRIEAKLDLLIQALAEELEQENDSQPTDLNGNTYGRERDDTQPL